MTIRVCVHNHTYKSKNAINDIEDFKKAFDEDKIDRIAITDHDYIHEAQRIQKKLGKDKIIVGQEITTKEGDIIGLFLDKFVPTGVSPERACQLIKAQEGIVYIPHPFAGKGLGEKVLERIKDSIDVIEGYNGWVHRGLAKPWANEKNNHKAKQWAEENYIPIMSSSDCHYRTNIGNCHTIMDDFENSIEFMRALKSHVELVENKNKANLVSVRTWIKGKLGRDLLSFI